MPLQRPDLSDTSAEILAYIESLEAEIEQLTTTRSRSSVRGDGLGHNQSCRTVGMEPMSGLAHPRAASSSVLGRRRKPACPTSGSAWQARTTQLLCRRA